MDTSAADIDQEVSTGQLPGWDRVETLVVQAYSRYVSNSSGVVADYIPDLAEVDPGLFALAVTEVGGPVHSAGDCAVPFSIQSISKAFVYALVCESFGHEEIRRRVGVNNTGLPFNSVIAIELNNGHPMNPMVNAGAIATTAMVPGATPAAKWEFIRTGLSKFAGRHLELAGDVYHSEMLTNQRNRAIAQLLESYGRIDVDPLDVVDIYTR